jgi:hypothetical protein
MLNGMFRQRPVAKRNVISHSPPPRFVPAASRSRSASAHNCDWPGIDEPGDSVDVIGYN